MESSLFSDDEFRSWSANQVMFLHVTTRVDTDKHQTLLKDKGFRGFPSLAVMDDGGEVIALPASRNLDGLRSAMATADSYLAVAAGAAAGEAGASAKKFILDLGLGRYKLASAKEALIAHAPNLPTEDKAAVKGLMCGLEYDERTAALRARMAELGPNYSKAYQALMIEMFRADKIPSGSRGASLMLGVMSSAFRNKDKTLLADALAKFEAGYGESKRYASAAKMYRDRLAQLDDS